jgi:solute carrier family 25 ornithine transporter 2/15
VFRDAASGLVGSVFCTYAGIPFDTVKVRMQTSNAAMGARAKSSWVCAMQMARTEGWRAFFRGSTPALASAMLENTVVFTAHGVLGRWLSPAGQATPTFSTSCLQHGLSGFCSSTCICPPEVIKVQLQNSSEVMSRDAVVMAMSKLWHTEGVGGCAPHSAHKCSPTA